MNNMDGLTATGLIREYFPKAKVMIVSQDDTKAVRQAATRGWCIGICRERKLIRHIR